MNYKKVQKAKTISEAVRAFGKKLKFSQFKVEKINRSTGEIILDENNEPIFEDSGHLMYEFNDEKGQLVRVTVRKSVFEEIKEDPDVAINIMDNGLVKGRFGNVAWKFQIRLEGGEFVFGDDDFYNKCLGILGDSKE